MPKLNILFTLFCLTFGITATANNLLVPYNGPSSAGVDTSTLIGKVMAGYQGWYNTEGDGANLGWTHWAENRRELFGPENVRVDLWPDVSEYDEDELYESGFKNEDGSAAKVFSSHNRKTVHRHFEWMKEYGIDGVFVQRFANGLRSVSVKRHKDMVLSHAREAANLNGRTYAVMYDLTGVPKGDTRYVRDDWKELRNKMKITEDPAYLRHKGKPVIAVLGIGFRTRSRDQGFTIRESLKLIKYLKSNKCAVMLGVPTGWRKMEKDTISDPEFLEVIEIADIVSPWTVGRYKNPESVGSHAEKTWIPDYQWCSQYDIDYMPVVFPGFSCHNLKSEHLDAIPRLKGQFLWSQFVAAKHSGAKMIYVAMFDEVDEGTAIFKCTNNPPVGDGVSFLTYEGLPKDYYLKLTNLGARMLRNEIPVTQTIPKVN